MAHTEAVGQLTLSKVLSPCPSPPDPNGPHGSQGAQGLLLPRHELDRGLDLKLHPHAQHSSETSRLYDEPARIALERRLRRSVGNALTLSLTLTDNRRTMLSIKRRAKSSDRVVRLHHMFLGASDEVFEALTRYLSYGDLRAGQRLDAFITEHRGEIRPAPTRSPLGRSLRHPTQGEVHDLITLRDDLSARYFKPALRVGISWARPLAGARARGPRRTLRMGIYYLHEAVIRIHPVLDQVWVPRYFIDWVIFHEMLHHVVPIPVVNGRRCFHSPEFRVREREFHDHERALQWERWNIRRLIASGDP